MSYVIIEVDPVDDAKGNAEALKKFREPGLKIWL